MLLNCFFRISSSVRANGYIIFESSTPGTYTVTFPRKTKCGVICVGGGGGGFAAKLGRFNPSSSFPTTGDFAFSGSSGGYSYIEYTFAAGETATIVVGAGGRGYSSSEVYGYVSSEHPSIYCGQGIVEGEISSVASTSSGSGYVCLANGGGGGRYLYESPYYQPAYGGYAWTTSGNRGNVSRPADSNISVLGGTSVYNNYGTGGNATRTSWSATDGGSGYVKIFIISTDRT